MVEGSGYRVWIVERDGRSPREQVCAGVGGAGIGIAGHQKDGSVVESTRGALRAVDRSVVAAADSISRYTSSTSTNGTSAM